MNDTTYPPGGIIQFYSPAREQFGELRLPAGDGRHPLLIFIHGGYWRARYDLSYAVPLCADLARRGIATWNLEYRRIGQDGGGWPGTFEDITRGIESVRELAQLYPLDLGRVALMGHSAGGHLALWAAARGRIFPEIAPDPLPLRAVIALAGVLDLQLAWEWHLSNDAVIELLGAPPDQAPDRYANASPAALVPLGIPQILFHGDHDDSVPYAMMGRYASQSQARGDQVTAITLLGAGHFELTTPGTPEWERVVTAVQDALA